MAGPAAILVFLTLYLARVLMHKVARPVSKATTREWISHCGHVKVSLS